MPRWNKKETDCISLVRERLHSEIAGSPAYPEVVGDRKIIRFLRGHDHNVDKVCDLMSKFLKWRVENNVNSIRKHIVEDGADHPLKFPKGDLVLSLIPQLVLAPDALDSAGAPICVEQYNFSPAEVLAKISIEEYVHFFTYVLEYRSTIIEQLSEERELAYLNSLLPEERLSVESDECTLPPYGVIVNTCVIRDLSGVGFEHLGAKGMDIIKSVIALASNNYPELMRKCFMINVPWVFHTVWYFVKGLLAAKTIAKVSVLGTSFQDELHSEIRPEYLPKMLGGTYVGYSEYVPFPYRLDYLCPHLTKTMDATTVISETTSHATESYHQQPIVSSESDAGEQQPDSSSSGSSEHTSPSMDGTSSEGEDTALDSITAEERALVRRIEKLLGVEGGDGSVHSSDERTEEEAVSAESTSTDAVDAVHGTTVGAAVVMAAEVILPAAECEGGEMDGAMQEVDSAPLSMKRTVDCNYLSVCLY